jgi:hypothetical protein
VRAKSDGHQFCGSQCPDNHHFWTFENRLDLGVLAALVAADAMTTQRGLNEGLREVNPMMRPFVTRGAQGEALGSALGFGAGVGAVYLLHRSHHYRLERMAMRTMVGVEGGFVVNNIIAIR